MVVNVGKESVTKCETINTFSFLLMFQVSDFAKYNFKPGDLVKNITQIYLSLGIEDEFLRAVVKDKRSFSQALFTSSIQVLE